MAEQLITEFYFFIEDPAAPERVPAFYVNTVDLTVTDDGRRFTDNPRQRNVAQAQADGLTLPAILDGLNLDAAARLVTLAGQVEALTEERDGLREQVNVVGATLGQVRAQLQALLDAQSPEPEPEAAPEPVGDGSDDQVVAA